jgi:hypothetical protein
MKTVMIMKWEDVTKEQYEQVRKSVNWEGNPPKGAIFHTASFGSNALHVVDLWETPEDFNKFVEQRLSKGTEAAGIKGQPQVETYPVHSTFVAAPDKLNIASKGEFKVAQKA